MSRSAALVIAWHQAALTVRALQSVAALQDAPRHIICIAQQFTPEEQAILEGQSPIGTDIVKLSENIGFAAAANLGIARAADAGAEWVLLLNNDATVAPSCLDACLRSADAATDVAAVAPAVVFADRPDLIWWAGGRLSARWGITRHPMLEQSVDRLAASGDTEFIPGCCVLYSTKAWKDIGGFAQAFFMYYEDADWCLRARQRGWRLQYVAKPLCRHAVGSSSGQRNQSALGVDSAYFLARNPLRAALDTVGLTTRLTRLIGVLAVWNSYNLLRILRSPGRGAVGRSYARGVRDGFRNRMGPRGHFSQTTH